MRTLRRKLKVITAVITGKPVAYRLHVNGGITITNPNAHVIECHLKH